LILEKILLLIPAAGACAMTVLAAGQWITAHAHVSMLTRLSNAVVSCAVYLRQMVWPEGLAVVYPSPRHGLPVWQVALAGVLVAGLSAVVWRERQRRPWLLIGWLWYLGMLTPMLGVVQVGAFAHADRYTYLPQIGICLAVTWLVAEWSMSREVVGGLMVGVVAALMICARKQNEYWQDSETLWNHTLACTTENALAHTNLGLALSKKGSLDLAITQYQKSLEIWPDFSTTHNNLASALLDEGRVDEAIAHELQALQLKPDYAEARYNLGRALFQKGRLDEAIVQYQAALELKPGFAAARLGLATALRKAGRLDEAIAQYQEALRIAPSFGTVHNDLGTALRQRGRVDEAIDHFQKALETMPDNESVHFNLANAFLQKGRVDEAIAQFQFALQILPDDLEVQNNLAWLLATAAQASLRNGDKAVQLAWRANELAGGKNPVILGTLAAAFAETGRFGDAESSVQKAIDLAEAAGQAQLAGRFRGELKHYKAGLPWRQ
jgi:tetratricopeptide (TPR) repeat protein